MYPSTLSEISERLGLEWLGDRAIGFVDGWPILGEARGQAVIFTVNTPIKANSAMNRRLTQCLKPYKAGPAWNQNVLKLLFNARTTDEKPVDELVRLSLGVLREGGLAPNDVCPVCRRAGCDMAILSGGMFRLAHGSCIQSQADQTMKDSEANLSRGSYLLGLIGAFLGMVVGTLPSLLTIISMEMVYSLAMALIPICSYYGYKLFRGKMNSAALVISIVMTVVGVLLIQWELVGYYVVKEYDMNLGLAVRFVLDTMRLPEAWGSILADSWKDFGMAALGVWASWNIISRTGKKDAQDWKLSLQYARPYNPDESKQNTL
ncbi:MAG: hypothetical protein IJJ23_08055 [Clostridia bacterium]|nr:hypothetical protein [Clostridia bacterium]